MRTILFLLLAYAANAATYPQVWYQPWTTNQVAYATNGLTNIGAIIHGALRGAGTTTLTTNNGVVTITSTGGGGSGSSTVAVNHTVVTNANFTNSATVTYSVSGSNITANTAFDTNLFVLTVEQPLTETEQSTVRNNIGSAAFPDTAGFPNIASRHVSVATGGTLTPVAGAAFGMNGPNGIHVQIAWVNVGDAARVWNDLTVREVELYVPATLPATAEIHVDFWRDTGDYYEFVGTTGNIRSLVNADDTKQKVTLTTPVFDIHLGDLIGGHLVYDGANWGGGFHAVAASFSQHVQYAYSVTLRDGAPWNHPSVGTVADSLIPIIVYGDSPVLTMIGDSRIDGYPYSRTVTLGGTGWSRTGDPAVLLSQITGLSVRNMGVAGDDTGEMLARIAAITNSFASAYVFCTGYYNDAYNVLRDETDFQNDSQSIINACLANGGKVVVVPDWPFKDFIYPPATDTDIQNAESDQFMGNLKDIIRANYAYTNVVWCDTRPYMGVARPDTGSAYWRATQLWDLKPGLAYEASTAGPPVGGAPGSIDLVHWSRAGSEQNARAIAGEMRRQWRKLTQPSSHNYYDLLPASKTWQTDASGIPDWRTIDLSSKQDADADLARLAGISGTLGDILWYSAAGWTNLGAGAEGYALKITGGIPQFAPDLFGAPGSGDDVWFNHMDIVNPNFTNSTTIQWLFDGTGTNTFASLIETYQLASGNLDEWTTVSTNSVTALGVGTLTADVLNVGVTNVASALAGKQPLGSYQTGSQALTNLSGLDGSYLTNSVPGGATNLTQFITLEQHLNGLSANTVRWLDTLSPANGFTLSGVNYTTNYSSVLLPAQNTNAAVAAGDGEYVAAFMSTNVFTSIASGNVEVELYAFENSGGTAMITAEAYIVNDVTKAEEYEFTPAPAYQSVFQGTTPTKMNFSIGAIDYISVTNLHLMIKIKVDVNSGTPPVRIVTGGIYKSHVAFTLPSQNFVSIYGDQLLGPLLADAGLSVGATNVVTALAGKQPLDTDLTALAANPQLYQATNAALTALASNPQLYQATNAALTALASNPNLYQATNANLTLLQAYGPTTWQATNSALTALASNPNLYQATNANLTLLQAYGPTTWQATNAALTALAGNPQLYQATNAALTALASNPQLYQATNAALTALASNPQLYQATNVNLTALAANPNLYQSTNTTLTRLAGIGAGSAGQVIVRDAAGWTNSAANPFQATNAALTALAGNPNLYQATNTVLTTWAGITPGANVGTFLATPSSANLRGAVTDESGTGVLIFAAGDIGAATATTPAENDNDTSVATTAYVQTELASISGTGDSLYSNGTAVSDEAALTNTVASATVASTTWSISAQASPSPDRVSVAIGPASATDAGIVTANAQTFAGLKALDGGITIGATNLVTALATKKPLSTTKYLILQRPDYTDGAGAVLQTNTLGASGLMHATFSGDAETNVNWAVYEFNCPPDLDVAVAMTATFSFLSGGTDTSDYVFHLTYGQVASGSAYPTGTGIASLPIVMTINTVTEANGDIQTSDATTLTGWAAALTPGLPMAIRVARLQNGADDGARDVCLVIAYGSNQ